MLHKLKFYSSIALVYAFTFGTIGAILYSPNLYSTTADATPHNSGVAVRPTQLAHAAISGIPVRITIPSYSIDLQVDTGRYDASTKKWTLSDTRAHYAEITPQANNRTGSTFIYGHGTDSVFGKIGVNPPPAGTIARVHTSNGHTFLYALKDVADLKPDQTHILKDTSTGPPRLIVQTCTGAFSEWRTIFTFSFKGIE